MVNPKETIRPARGPKPRFIWLQDRATDLSRSIHEHLIQDARGKVKPELVMAWITELQKVMVEIAKCAGDNKSVR